MYIFYIFNSYSRLYIIYKESKNMKLIYIKVKLKTKKENYCRKDHYTLNNLSLKSLT